MFHFIGVLWCCIVLYLYRYKKSFFTRCKKTSVKRFRCSDKSSCWRKAEEVYGSVEIAFSSLVWEKFPSDGFFTSRPSRPAAKNPTSLEFLSHTGGKRAIFTLVMILLCRSVEMSRLEEQFLSLFLCFSNTIQLQVCFKEYIL
jgi:hypothetical protein